MPEKKGIDVAKEIKEVYPDAVICFITSYEDYAYEAYRTEALGYLVKPVKYQELRRMLEKSVRLSFGGRGDIKLHNIKTGQSVIR